MYTKIRYKTNRIYSIRKYISVICKIIIVNYTIYIVFYFLYTFHSSGLAIDTDVH